MKLANEYALIASNLERGERYSFVNISHWDRMLREIAGMLQVADYGTKQAAVAVLVTLANDYRNRGLFSNIVLSITKEIEELKL